MTTTETSVNVHSDFQSMAGDDSSSGDDVVVQRRSRSKVLPSDDEGDEGDTDSAELKMVDRNVASHKETTSLNKCEVSDVGNIGCEDNEMSEDICGGSQSNGKISKRSKEELDISTNFSKAISQSDDNVRNEEKSWNPTRLSRILDSDSEDEDFNSLFTQKATSKIKNSSLQTPGSDDFYQTIDGHKSANGNKLKRVIGSDSEDEKVADNRELSSIISVADKIKNNKNILKPDKISALIDTDSEDDLPTRREFETSSNENEHSATSTNVISKKGKSEKKRSGSIRAAKEEAMREIHSETQRMLRESQVYLPYHRPKQRTLQEFLNRKKSLPKLPATLATAAKVRMSGELVGKVLEEKEKEAELFYKSSSESDSEDPGSTATNTQLQANVVNNDVKTIPIEDTQKVTTNDLQNCQNKKEIIKQGDKNIGVPRKLFSAENEFNVADCPSPVEDDDLEEMSSVNTHPNQRRKEFKHGLNSVSIPRKLFESECEEPTDANFTTTQESQDINTVDKVQENCEEGSKQLTILNELDPLVESQNADRLVENQNTRINESTEDKENFELKMSEDPFELVGKMTDLQSNKVTKVGENKFEAIIDTPFINNHEVFELNDKKKTESEIRIANEILAENNKTESNELHLGSSESSELSSIASKSQRNKEDQECEDEPIGHVYGLPLPEFDGEKPRVMKTLILPSIMKLIPKLQGSPGMMVELSSPKAGLDELRKRFLKHSVKKTFDSSSEVTVMHTEQTASGLKVINEVLPYKAPSNENNEVSELSKPGTKFMRLKKELQHQMAVQRTNEWKQKEMEIENSKNDDVYDDELSDCEMADDANKDDELSDTEISEPEEDDIPITDKKETYKSPFLDGEAEVSGEELEENQEEEFSEVDDAEDTDSNESINDNEDVCEEDEQSENEDSQNNKFGKLKRIKKAFEDDDSNDSEAEDTGTGLNKEGKSSIRRMKTDVDIFATDNNSQDDSMSSTEGDLPVYQRSDERSQSCATPSVINNSLSLISPITQLTALNTGSELTSTDFRSVHNSSQSMTPLGVGDTPIEEKHYRTYSPEKREKLQKQLFADNKGSPNETELMSLCSGPFFSPSDNNELDKLMHTSRKTSVSDAELLELCSGTFATQPVDIEKLEASQTKEQMKEKQNETDDMKFLSHSSKKIFQQPHSDSNELKIVFSSDDEDDTFSLYLKNSKSRKSRKKVKTLKLSDDEDENDGEISLNFNEKQDVDENFVDYDSEENEIIVPKKDIKKTAAGFLDEEAELSESEWGSSDEDEKDLDKLDMEEGDLEDIDQDQVKKQLEKMHMKQVLDEDQREVRLLQEILLEDGELHSDGASRQRKFKWKNIDKLGDDNEQPLQNIDEEANTLEDPTEVESELEWRKQRLEREQFLKEHKINAAEKLEKEMDDSQLFELGLRALKRNKCNKTLNKNSSIDSEISGLPVPRNTVADLFAKPGSGTKTSAIQTAIHRGSFLARGEESLARLSLITKQNSDQTTIRTKNPRNFVFAHLSPAIEVSAEDDTKSYSQENDNTAAAKSRKRKPAFNMTPLASKKSKKEFHKNSRSKLFD
ncbi:claspin-like [Diprion similis]|uniref:claspin-like n=1 Tax=Diprion similis TaxID=362088 RepID=UPI001EF95CC1|nr:claspin-like [Diprion similis]